jgi:hypothetical protein
MAIRMLNSLDLGLVLLGCKIEKYFLPGGLTLDWQSDFPIQMRAQLQPHLGNCDDTDVSINQLERPILSTDKLLDRKVRFCSFRCTIYFEKAATLSSP